MIREGLPHPVNSWREWYELDPDATFGHPFDARNDNDGRNYYGLPARRKKHDPRQESLFPEAESQ